MKSSTDQYWYYCTDSYVITFGAILCLFYAILGPVDVFCCLFYAILSPFCRILHFFTQNQKYAHFLGWNYRKPINLHFSNYRQKYRYRIKTSSNYRWIEEIIGKVIDIKINSKIIKKLSLSKKITYRTPLLWVQSWHTACPNQLRDLQENRHWHWHSHICAFDQESQVYLL